MRKITTNYQNWEKRRRNIGRYLSEKQIDAIYIGPRKRHIQTYEAARQENWPMPIQTYWLDGFPAHEMMNKGLDQCKTMMPDLISNYDDTISNRKCKSRLS